MVYKPKEEASKGGRSAADQTKEDEDEEIVQPKAQRRQRGRRDLEEEDGDEARDAPKQTRRRT